MEAAGRDRLERSLELYRDLSLALRERITQIRSGPSALQEEKQTADAVRAHHKALQSIIDIEASLGKYTEARGGGASAELDLGAARAEIAARLARWSEQG